MAACRSPMRTAGPGCTASPPGSTRPGTSAIMAPSRARRSNAPIAISWSAGAPTCVSSISKASATLSRGGCRHATGLSCRTPCSRANSRLSKSRSRTNIRSWFRSFRIRARSSRRSSRGSAKVRPYLRRELAPQAGARSGYGAVRESRGVVMAKKRLGILTGGGDVPGLNSVIKTVTYRSSENDIEVVGLRRGWEALTHLDPEDPNSRRRYLMALDRENTRIIDRRGGTVLHSSRTNPAKMTKLPDHLAGKDFPLSVSSKGIAGNTWDVSKQVLANLSALGIEHLIAIGGDDTLGYAAKLNELGVKIIAIPKTMDNDVHNTEYCIGFSTAITRASDAIQRQRTTVASHERIGIFRVFGRDAGFTALYTAYTTSIRCVVPEYKVNLDKLIRLLIEEKRANPSNYALVVLSEGAEW